jgi:hypothetical protein
MSVHPITQLVRNAIIRVLFDAHPQALTTPELLLRLAQRYGCNHNYRRAHGDPSYIPDSLPHGCTASRHSCRGGCWHTQAYPNLRALAKDCVEWIPGRPSHREACWRHAPTREDAADPAWHPGIVDLDAEPNTEVSLSACQAATECSAMKR